MVVLWLLGMGVLLMLEVKVLVAYLNLLGLVFLYWRAESQLD